MKGITKKLGAVIAFTTLFGLVSCSSQVAVDGTGTGGGVSGGSSGGSTTDGGSGSGNNTGGGSTNTGGGSDANTGGGTGGNTDNSGGTATVEKYVVQLLATSDASKAETVIRTFAKEGYRNINKNTVTINGQAIHRVQIGPFGTQADGQRVLSQMKRRYHKNQYVNSAVVKTVYGK